MWCTYLGEYISAILQNSSTAFSPHVALAVILAFNTVLKGLGNIPPDPGSTMLRCNGCELSDNSLNAGKREYTQCIKTLKN